MALLMMDHNAEAGPSRTPWVPPKAVPLVLQEAIIRKPASLQPIQKPTAHPIVINDTPSPPPIKKRRTLIEVVIPVKRRIRRIGTSVVEERLMTVDPDSEEEEESESATPPAPRRRVEHPPIRVQVPPPPALPREVPAYLLSVNPVASSVRFRRTKGPLGLGSPPAPPLQPKPRLQGNPPYNLHIHVSRSKGGYFEACGTEADSDLWASSTFHALPYVVAVTAEEQDLRDYIRMRPTREDKGKGKAVAGAAEDKGKAVAGAAEDAARIADGMKEEERRNGRSASTALAIDSDEEGEVAVPHSQTMPIEHAKVTARATLDDTDDIGEERERSHAPFRLLTGDQRFQSTKAFTSAGVLPYARKSPYTPIPAKPAQQPVQDKQEDAKSAAEEGSKSATPEPTARRTRAQLRPRTPPPVPIFDAVRTAARRVAYMEHGTTIGADVWCTMLEFEERAAGLDGGVKAEDATDAAAWQLHNA